MHFVLFLVANLVYLSSAFHANSVNGNHIQEFEKTLVTLPKTYKECYKKLLCSAFNSSDSAKLAMQQDVQNSMFEMTRQFEELPLKTQRKMTNTSNLVTSFMNTIAGTVPDCDKEFPDCLISKDDLFWFQDEVQMIIDEMTSGSPSEDFRFLDTLILQEKNANISEESDVFEQFRRSRRCSRRGCRVGIGVTCGVAEVGCSVLDFFTFGLGGKVCRYGRSAACFVGKALCRLC